MRIIFKESFTIRLGQQVDYIAKNNPLNARKFKSELIERLKQLPSNPYQYRKSIYFNDPQIRDFIFKGYTIVFLITSKSIVVFGFVKFQERPD